MPEPMIYDRIFYRESVNAVVTQAIKRGYLARPESCEMCGRRAYVQAHHDDYSRWLDVRWLCSACHGVAHRENHRNGVDHWRNVELPALRPNSVAAGIAGKHAACTRCPNAMHPWASCPEKLVQKWLRSGYSPGLPMIPCVEKWIRERGTAKESA
jgi:hypothetical protein